MQVQNVGWWGAVNRLWLMAAVGNLLWTILPQLLLLMPNKKTDNVTASIPISSLMHKPFSEERRLRLKEEARRMFYWGYENYITHAFPYDELNPINCSGRGHDWENLWVPLHEAGNEDSLLAWRQAYQIMMGTHPNFVLKWGLDARLEDPLSLTYTQPQCLSLAIDY